ncbi:MAG: hypothetical protein HYV07_03950 [Deltaproteobacteria bacterium]|nr:hypothetical protein [Deltaproteobacteria bacterium]
MGNLQEHTLHLDARLLARPEVRSICVSGPDRTRFLNGMLTNDVSRLVPGEGELAVKVSAKGRVEAVVRARCGAQEWFLEAIDPVAEPLKSSLERFVIMEDVTLTFAAVEVLAVLGESAADVLGRAGLATPRSMHGFSTTEDVTVIRDCTLGIAGFELHAREGAGEALRSRLIDAGAILINRAEVELARVVAGWPLDGRDLDGETFPMEVEALERAAISYDKGCYVGQEVIARARNLGHVNYRLAGLSFEGGPSSERAPISLDGDAAAKPVGEVRSVVEVPGGGAIALAFVHRKVAVGQRVKAGDRFAVVTPLPFR